MSRTVRRIAATLLRWSGHLMPAERKQWADAMRGEFEAIAGDRAALGFALGCLLAAARQGVSSMAFLAGALTKAIPAALCALAVLAVHLSGRHGGVATAAGTVFGLLFAVFAAGLALFVAKGAGALARFAAMLVPVYAVLLVVLRFTHGSADGTPHSVLYRALAIEGLAIWTSLLLGAVVLTFARARRFGGQRS